MTRRFERIADDLRLQIHTGKLPSDTRLPAEQELSRRYGVGLPTLRQALALLQAEGLIEKNHGRGNFVRNRPPVTYTNDRHLPGTVRDAAEHEFTASHITACAALSALLVVPEGAPLRAYTYVALDEADGTALSLTDVYVPEDIPITDPPNSLTCRSLWGDEIRDRLTAAGITIDHTSERITARPPTSFETDVLAIPTGVHVLTIERTTVDTRGRTVEAAHITIPATRAEVIYTTSN
jgi:GntR family transcriptional regulator